MFEKIGDTIQKGFEYSSYEEMTKNSPHFKQGVKDFKEGNVKNLTAKIYWVKREVSNKEWKDFYKDLSAYCDLGKQSIGKSERIVVGFAAAGGIPADCEECSDDEILRIDNYRRAYNIHPFPCGEIEE